MEELDAATLRQRAYRRSRQILEAHARKRKGRDVERPGDVLEDIAETYDYEPWDVALVAALTVLLHPRTRVPEALRAETARITAERRRVVQAIQTLQAKFMQGDRPILTCVQFVLAPRPAVGLVYATGRPQEWALDEFAGAIRVILGQARVPGMPEPPREPIGQALDMGKELLDTLGIKVRRRSLEERAAALPDLPPAPDDADPLAWAQALSRRFTRVPEGRDILRRVFTPAEDLPLLTVRYRVTANSPDIVVRRFRRKALPPKP
jgi:hypothetical protein